MIWISSDFHFGHNKPFLYKPRGFGSIQEHDETIIKNWNELVKPEDDVYVLGDLVLGDTWHGLECLKQLKGHIHIVHGNHDSDNRIEKYLRLSNVVEYCGFATIIKQGKQRFYLSHYPTITSNCDSNKPLTARVINLCGHSHTKDVFADWDKGLIYHCELDAHDNRPVLLDDIRTEIKMRLNK